MNQNSSFPHLAAWACELGISTIGRIFDDAVGRPETELLAGCFAFLAHPETVAVLDAWHLTPAFPENVLTLSDAVCWFISSTEPVITSKIEPLGWWVLWLQTTDSLNALFGGLGEQIVRELLVQGYITHERLTAGEVRLAPRAPQTAAHASTRPESHGGADAFTGPRSLASARMFLFDISERMFAPREMALAQQFRDALREARDASAMLEVSRKMLISIEAMAGPARASAVRDRLEKLLPD